MTGSLGDPIGTRDRGSRAPTVAYVMSRFPKLTETFVLAEMQAVERAGVRVALFPLLREHADQWHPAAVPWMRRATYLPFLSWPIVRSNVWFLRHRPRRYVAAVWSALLGTSGSANFFVGALGILPKVVHAARLMEEEGVGHVHCHFANHPALAGFVVRRLTGIPWSFTAHGSDLHKDRHMLPRKVREAAFVVAVSEHNRDVIDAECGPLAHGKVHVVGCGVDTAVFAPSVSRPAGDPLRVVAVGTLHEVKGFHHLIDACARAIGSGVNLRCEIVGGGPDRTCLEARARALGIAERVLFDGPLPMPEVLEVVRRSHVLVAPSVPTRSGRREGIPVVLMEAMSCGLPVVASRLSGIPELVDDGVEGILVEPGDTEGLAAGLERLAADGALRCAMGAAGRRRICRDHGIDVTAARLIELMGAGAR